MMSYIQRYLNVSKDEVELISKNPYTAQKALNSVIDQITEIVEDIKYELENKVHIPLQRLTALKTVKEAVRNYQSQLAEVISQEEDEAKTLLDEIEKL
jgi:predicted transcriptional regulator